MPLSWPAEYAATFSSEVPALPKCVCLSICLVCLPARPPHGPSPLSPEPWKEQSPYQDAHG